VSGGGDGRSADPFAALFGGGGSKAGTSKAGVHKQQQRMAALMGVEKF
jgi:hypothetical protein